MHCPFETASSRASLLLQMLIDFAGAMLARERPSHGSQRGHNLTPEHSAQRKTSFPRAHLVQSQPL